MTASEIGILAMGQALPPYRVDQGILACWMAEHLGAQQPALRRWIKRLYELSGIESRYSCLPDGMVLPDNSRFDPTLDPELTPTTAERMAIYQREAVTIGVAAAERALSECSDQERVADSVTHLIVVSCTGFFAPGLDYVIARELKLRPTVERTLIGFMGCAAAFNALRLARQIVAGQPTARVLIVCVELCTLHIQAASDRINLVVGSLFADGAAACLVGTVQPQHEHVFTLNRFFTGIKPDTEQDMAWQIGDHGFAMRLSPDVPRHLAEFAPHALDTLLHGEATPAFWAIHPGGRAIVDRLAELFGLTDEQAAPSIDVLRHYGNMSSPTILFVLHALREQLRHSSDQTRRSGVAMAFGPGLVAEMAHLTYHPAQPNLRLGAAEAESVYAA